MIVSISPSGVEISDGESSYTEAYEAFIQDGGQALRDGVSSYSFDGRRTYKNGAQTEPDSYAEKVLSQLQTLIAAQADRIEREQADGLAQIAADSAAALAERREAMTEVEIEQELKDAVQDWMDRQAQARGYDNVFTVLSYKDSSVERWREDAQAALPWRDAVWVECHRLLRRYKAGEFGILTPEQVFERLPKITWSDKPDPE